MNTVTTKALESKEHRRTFLLLNVYTMHVLIVGLIMKIDSRLMQNLMVKTFGVAVEQIRQSIVEF